MRRAKLMIRGLVLAALLLVLVLLPTVSMAAAKGPKPPIPSETRSVTFIGEITGGGTLVYDSKGSGFRLYTPLGEATELTFVETGTSSPLWRNETNDFAGLHGDSPEEGGALLIKVDERTGEVYIEYLFDRYSSDDIDDENMDLRYENWYKYRLEGIGDWLGESATDGTIVVEEEPFKIYKLIWEAASKKSDKSASGPGTRQLWAGHLDFTITIGP